MDDTTNLTPRVWNAPNKPYHLKSVRFDHYKDGPREKGYLCNKCGALVVYTTSKTGKRYLCDAKKQSIKTDHRGRRMRQAMTMFSYYPFLWHSKTCVQDWDGSVHPKADSYRQRVAELRGEG